MLEGEKNNLQAHTQKKKFHCESRCWKKNSRPDQITPPPPVQKSNGRPLIARRNISTQVTTTKEALLSHFPQIHTYICTISRP